MSISLFNTFRPKTFEDITEQSLITQTIKNQVITGKVAHSYLLYGPRGVGKTTIARIIAKAINCLNTTDGEPCGVCTSCKSIEDNKALDIVEIDAASNTGVDNVREEIIDKAIYPPTSLRYKVYIIDEVHMLSKSAFNALLKIMEEPPAHIVFILATTDLHKVPETIVSRCQVYGFRRISKDGIIARLEHICKLSDITYEREALEIIARVVDGGMRDAVKYLDQLAHFGNISVTNTQDMLGVASLATVHKFLGISDYQDMTTLVQNLSMQGIDAYIFLKDVVREIGLQGVEKYQKILDICFDVMGSRSEFPWIYLLYKLNDMLTHGQEKPQDKKSQEKKASVSVGSENTILLDEVLHAELVSQASPELKTILTRSCVCVQHDDHIEILCIQKVDQIRLSKMPELSDLIMKLTQKSYKITIISKEDFASLL